MISKAETKLQTPDASLPCPSSPMPDLENSNTGDVASSSYDTYVCRPNKLSVKVRIALFITSASVTIWTISSSSIEWQDLKPALWVAGIMVALRVLFMAWVWWFDTKEIRVTKVQIALLISMASAVGLFASSDQWMPVGRGRWFAGCYMGLHALMVAVVWWIQRMQGKGREVRKVVTKEATAETKWGIP